MNEEALNDAYKHFVDTGYDGTIEDYKVLMLKQILKKQLRKVLKK